VYSGKARGRAIFTHFTATQRFIISQKISAVNAVERFYTVTLRHRAKRRACKVHFLGHRVCYNKNKERVHGTRQKTSTGHSEVKNEKKHNRHTGHIVSPLRDIFRRNIRIGKKVLLKFQRVCKTFLRAA